MESYDVMFDNCTGKVEKRYGYVCDPHGDGGAFFEMPDGVKTSYGATRGNTTEEEIEDCVRTLEHDEVESPSEEFDDEVAAESIRKSLARFVSSEASN